VVAATVAAPLFAFYYLWGPRFSASLHVISDTLLLSDMSCCAIWIYPVLFVGMGYELLWPSYAVAWIFSSCQLWQSGELLLFSNVGVMIFDESR
jgi:hypothetical protein